MLTPGRVDALIFKHKAGDRDVIHDVRLDDLSDIFGLHLAVPHGFGIDDHRGPVLALIEASGFVGAHQSLETAIRNRRFEQLLQVALGALGATSANARGLALIGTDEDVFLKFGHIGIVSTESFGAGYIEGCWSPV